MMKEKEKLIIETGIKLFATKGFTATSIQEIATECSISKGAFYLYFKSKEALLLAIFEYYYSRIQERVKEIDNQPLQPRERFVKQIHCHYDEISKHKEFIIMQVREHAIPFNEAIETFIRNMRVSSNLYYQRILMEIYGDAITPYIWDMTVMLQGIFHSFLELIIFEVTELNLDHLSHYLLKRADDLVKGLTGSDPEKEKPILSTDAMNKLLAEKVLHPQKTKRDLLAAIDDAKERFYDHPKKEDITITLEVLEEEIKREESRAPVIQGMLANFSSFPELTDLKSLIEEFFFAEKK